MAGVVYDASMDQQSFLISEFSALRREIELEIKELRELLRYAILSSGAIWAWLLSRSQPMLSRVGCFLPLALSLLLLGQSLLVRKKVFGLGAYLQRIEQAFKLPDRLGWETQLTRGIIKRDNLPRWENTVWAVLCLGNLAGALMKWMLLPG